MNINIKLVPYQSNPDFNKVFTFGHSPVLFKEIIQEFINVGISIVDISKIKFISNGKHYTDIDATIDKTNTNFYLFTHEEDIKTELTNKLYGNPVVQISQSKPSLPPAYKEQLVVLGRISEDEESEGEDYEDNEININEFNNTIKESITPELLQILRICINKPQLINMATSYLSNGNIEEDIEIVDLTDSFSHVDELQYIQETFSEYNWSTQMIMAVLEHYDGHINMTLRYLFNETLIQKN